MKRAQGSALGKHRVAGGDRSQLDFVRLGGEAEGLDHAYDAGRWNILGFAV